MWTSAVIMTLTEVSRSLRVSPGLGLGLGLGWFGTKPDLLVHVCFHSANLKANLKKKNKKTPQETQVYLLCIANNKQHCLLAYLLHQQGFTLAAFLKFSVAKRLLHCRHKSAFYANIGKHQLRFPRSFKGMSIFFRVNFPLKYRPSLLSLKRSH